MSPDGAGPVACDITSEFEGRVRMEGKELVRLTAEGGIENDIIATEMLIDRATRPAHKRRGRIAPTGWIRHCSERIRRDGVSGEEPDTDGVAGPLHGVDTASVRIETVTERSPASSLDTAARIALTVLIDHRTATARVHRDCILRLEIDAFDDVDFAIVGPRGAGHPKRRPNATCATGHVLQVENYEPMCVLGFAGEADAVAATA